MLNSRLVLGLLLVLSVLSSKVELKESDVEVLIKTPDQQSINFKTGLLSTKKDVLKATQSSKIYVYSKLKFSKELEPQFVAARLVLSKYPNTTQPALGTFNKGTGKVQIVLDIGNPLMIQPISGQYSLELMISDSKLDKGYRSNIVTVQISFAKSLDTPNPGDLHYEPKQEIVFKLAGERVDPPPFFTMFVVLLIIGSFLGFIYTLLNLKSNLNLLPLSGLGGILNITFLLMIGGMVLVLGKFWLSWSFLETVRVLGIMVIPTVIVGNYAILNVNN